MNRRVVCTAVAAVSGLLLAGCSSPGGGTTPRTPPPPIDLSKIALVAYASCDTMLSGLRKATEDSVGSRGWPGSEKRPVPPVPPVPGNRRAQAPQEADGRADDSGQYTNGKVAAAPEQQEHSTTNVHEKGVDEPDLVQTDGKRILTIRQDGTLMVVDAATRRRTGTVDVTPGYAGVWSPAHLLLHGDRALALLEYGGTREYPLDEFGGKPVPRPGMRGPRLVLLDLAGEQPRVIGSLTADGAYVDARQVGSLARIVVRSRPRIEFPTPRDVPGARAAVRKAPIEAWLPRYEIEEDGASRTATVPCEHVSHPPEYTGTSMLTVHTVDLAGSLDRTDPISVVADGDTVYGSGKSLYVASSARSAATQVHKFDMGGPGRPRYSASGEVHGHLLNQYSMSEHEGHLRLATTISGGTVPYSAVSVLSQQGKALRQIGKVGGLGKGERIYAVRYLGPVAYVVTFRRTDPLYAIDLRDPANPRVTGELKITGYSAYLHPVGDGRLIGVGQEATEQGRRLGTQVSLFDVGDPANPRRLAQYHLPGTSAQAEVDPHAFLYWPPTGLMVLPLKDRADGGAALVLSVRDDRVNKIGSVRHPLTGGPIQRSLLVGDTLWTVSRGGLRANDVRGLAEQAWIPFPSATT